MRHARKHQRGRGGMHWDRAWALAWLLVLSSSLAVPVAAVTFSYDAVVTSTDGPHSDVFPEGEPLAISYTLDSQAADSEANPQRGYFPNAVLSLSVVFPVLGVSAVAGAAGVAETADNIVDASSGAWSDQVFLLGGPISSASLLGGEPIASIEVDFLSRWVTPPVQPMMLASDALPLFELPLTDSLLLLRTNSGVTFVSFASITAEATPTKLPTSTPTPTSASTATASSTDGCAIDLSHGTALGGTWRIVLPALLLWARPRKRRRGSSGPSDRVESPH